jgi:hypothetical protein
VEVAAFDLGHRSGQAAHCRHTLQRTGATGWGKDDDPIAVPCPASAVRGVAQGLGRATIDGYPLEFASCEESNRAAVGRPERIPGVFSATQRLRIKRIERPNPKRAFFATRGDRQVVSIRRQGKRVNPRLFWRLNGVPKNMFRWLSFP